VRPWFRFVASTIDRSAVANRNKADALIIQDVTLLHQVDVFAGLSTEGYVLINTSKSFDELGLGDYLRTFHRERLLTCPATEIALSTRAPVTQCRIARRFRRAHRTSHSRVNHDGHW